MFAYLNLLIILALLILPIVLGTVFAKKVRMPDYGWKISLILFTLSVAGMVTYFGWPPKLGIDLKGGVSFIYEVDQSQRDKTQKLDMDEVVRTLGVRVNPGGQKEVTVRQLGEDQIEIIIPDIDVEESKRIERKISRSGALEFRILANDNDHKSLIDKARKDKGDKVYIDGKLRGRWVPVRKNNEEDFRGRHPRCAYREVTRDGKPVLEFLVHIDEFNVTGEYLIDASVGRDQSGRRCVNFKFNSEGAQNFGRLTMRNRPNKASNFYRKLAIILDGSLQSAARLQGVITSKGQISGTFSEEDVKETVAVLNEGSLPVALSKEPISRMRSGPLLGHDTIIKGSYAIGISLILVLLFMLFYYRFSGLVACGALLANLLLILGIMVTVKADFTLTGLAGLVLTIGMAVDANVLIFERIREELARGAALRMAIRNGFNRATTTIVDANVTTLITGLVLYIVGTDQIKGFAVVLILGVTLSMYTAIFCSRVVFDIGERRHWIKKLTMMQVVGETKFDFIGVRHMAAVASLVVIVAGMIGVYARGQSLLGLDFTGGVSIQVLFDEDTAEQKIGEVRKAARKVWPHVAVSTVQLEGEKAGHRFMLNIMQEEGKDVSITSVEKKVHETFAGKLASNSVSVGEVTQASGDSESGGESEAEKPAQPATKDQSRGDLPDDSLMAAADDSLVLLAQADTTEPTQPGDAATLGDTTGGEKPVEEPVVAPPVKTPEDKPAEKSEETPVEEPKVDPPVTPPAEPTGAETPVKTTATSDWSEVVLTFKHKVSHDTLEEVIKDQFAPLNEKTDQREGIIPRFNLTTDGFSPGDSKAYQKWTVKMLLPPEDVEKVMQNLATQTEETPFFPASNTIGGRVASKTQTRAIMALVASLICIIGYIWIRFQRVMYGLAAVVALVHDVLITLGAIALSTYLAGYLGFLKIEDFKIGLSTLAAFLTIIGYSLNDTIVVFDRIREVRGKSPRLTADMVNASINQTLSRTLLTSLTTLIVVVILYFFGGSGIHSFAFALVVGVLVGTYSSIFVASPVLLWMSRTSKRSAN